MDSSFYDILRPFSLQLKSHSFFYSGIYVLIIIKSILSIIIFGIFIYILICFVKNDFESFKRNIAHIILLIRYINGKISKEQYNEYLKTISQKEKKE